MAHGVVTADIIMDFELGVLNKAQRGDAKNGSLPKVASIPGYDWRAQVLDGDGDDVLARIIRTYTGGATLYKTKGFWNGTGSPGYVIRLIGRDPRDQSINFLMGEDELFAVAECIAHRIRTFFAQEDVWMIKTYADGHRELWMASENASKQKKCKPLDKFPARRVRGAA